MSSIILRRSAVAETELEGQRDAAATSESTQFSLSQRIVRPCMETFAAALMAKRARLPFNQLFDMLVSVAMLGGVFVVPVATLIAVVCAWLPQSHPLHRTAPTLFAVASLWFLAALLLSHFQPRFGCEHHREAA